MPFNIFILQLLRRLRPLRRLPTYDTFQDVVPKERGYQDSDLVQAVSRKTEIFKDMLWKEGRELVLDRPTVQNMFVICHAWKGNPLNVLDIGGACGATFFQLDCLLPGKIGRWGVIETHEMASMGRQNFTDDRLAFYDDLEQAVAGFGSPDLLFASGVLQYLPSPLEVLGDWIRVGAEFIYLTRTPVGVGLECPAITKQTYCLSNHGPGPLPEGIPDRMTSQPITFLPQGALVSGLSQGYKVQYAFDEGGEESFYVGSRKVTIRTFGYLLGALSGKRIG